MRNRSLNIFLRFQFQRLSRGDGTPKPGPPPTLPAPVPTPTVPDNYQKQGISQSHSFSSSGGPPMIEQRKPATMNFSKPVSTPVSTITLKFHFKF